MKRVLIYRFLATACLFTLPAMSVLAQPPMHMGPMHMGPMMNDDEHMMRGGNSMMGYGMQYRHGMMGGQGMMGGYGAAGYPMTQFMWGALASVDLKEEQMQKIQDIRSKLRDAYADLQDELEIESLKLAKKYRGEKLDPSDIGESYDKIFDVRRRMIEKRIEGHNEMFAVLTKEQKDKLDQHGLRWMMP